MKLQLLASAFALVLAPVAARAEDENPYKNSKVGDYAIFKITISAAGQEIAGTIVQTVKARTEKEVTLTVAATLNGMEVPAQEQKIDLTQPFDPAKYLNLPGGGNLKIEKGKEGREKIKVAGKEVESNWMTFSAKGKANGFDIDAEIKVWISKELKGAPIVKMESTMSYSGMKQNAKMEVTEIGSKK